MESIKTVLVHLDAGGHAARRLEFARGLAARHDARLKALFAVMPRFLPLPLPIDGGGVPGAPLLAEVDPEHRAQAKKTFDRVCGSSGWPAQWEELGNEDAVQGFVQHALWADMLVLGQRDPVDAQAFDLPADFAEAVLMGSGRPAIILPIRPALPDETAIAKVLVAWQPKREPAHALDSALPLLHRAESVHLVVWMNDAAQLSACREQLLDYLRLHGVSGVHLHHGPEPADPGSSMLALADGIGANLLVMGCFGHSRLRELVLGGATRTVLRDMRLPVLMTH